MESKKIAWLFLIIICTIIGGSASVLSLLEVLSLSVVLGGVAALIFRRFFTPKNN